LASGSDGLFCDLIHCGSVGGRRDQGLGSHRDGNAGHEWLVGVEIGKACIFGFEAEGSSLVEALAEQVQAIAGEGDVVGRERKEQVLRRSG
jgi:hypothetical protein